MSEELPLPGRGIKPLVSFRAHKKLALGAFIVVMLAGIPFAWIKGKPFYQTEASIQVAPRYMRNLKEDPELDFQSNQQYRQFVENQRTAVTRYDVLRDALNRMGDKRSLWQLPKETERHAIERLRDKLQVSAIGDTYLLRIALDGDKKEGLAEVINAVIPTFMERMKDEQIYGADLRAKNLREREKELIATIAAKGGQRSLIAQKLSLTTFNEGTPNPYDRLVADLRYRLSEAHQRRVDADASLTAFKTRGDTTIAVRSVLDAVLTDPGLNSLKGALNARRALLLVQKSGLRPDHPGALAADRELAEIDAELLYSTGKMEAGVRANLLARLQGTADLATTIENGLQAELTALESQAGDYARLFQDAMSITNDILQSRGELDKVRERINFIGVESSSLGFLQLVAPALEPDLPFGPGRKKLLILVIFAALAAAVVVPVARDLLDSRIRTVNDAQRLMGVVPAGWQLRRDFGRDQIFADEQLRRIGAALLRSRQLRGQRVFGFTGCRSGAGSSTLVLELACTLRLLGYSVLAVEANGYSRDERFGSDRPGLLELLQGRASAAEVVAEGDAELPPRVSVGGRGRIGLERLDRLGPVLHDWAETTDFVFVDMPPLLISADAELLVPIVGQVLLVLEAEVVTKGEVMRARRLLQALDPAAVGVVVTGIVPFDGGGYLTAAIDEAAAGERVAPPPPWQRAWSRLRNGFGKGQAMTSSFLRAFDRICIVNLPEREDRRREVTRELARQGIDVDGRQVRFVEAIRPDAAGDFPSIGARGCYLSHLKTLKQAQADGVRRLLVLEDDAMFTPAMREAAPLAETILGGGWQLAYPGHVEPSLPGPLRWERTDAPLVCAHCYAVQGSALPLVIDYLEACLARPAGHPDGGAMHYDGALTMLRQARPDLVTLIASRSLASQRSSRSDIIGPSWIDRLPFAGLARGVRNGWRRWRQPA
jgi:Mrp family chromosome partitioning ATPase/uncharacterized protein involved in exopolysaccharide biosynthesis